MANSANPDQLASEEANRSGSTLFATEGISRFSRTTLFATEGISRFSRTRVIYVTSRQWKGENERLYAMKCHTVISFIVPPAGLEHGTL